MQTSRRIQANKLQTFIAQLCETVGTPRNIAESVSRILVNADLKGHTSHGVFLIRHYMHSIEHEGLFPSNVPEILQQTPSTAFVDARKGWGHYSAQWSMNLAMQKARSTGIGAVSFVNMNHIGRLGEYVEQAASEGFIGIVTEGWGAPGPGEMTSHGVIANRLSTNPVALGVPSADGKPFISDFATTVFANSKVHVYKMKGMKLPPGCIVDKHGQPSVEPDDYIEGGRLLVFGGIKGYAISLMTCLLGALGGAFNRPSGGIGGTLFQAIDVSAFQPLEDYQQNASAFLEGMRSTPPAPDFSEVLVPGDLERRVEQEQLRDGIELPETVWSKLLEYSEKYNLVLELELER